MEGSRGDLLDHSMSFADMVKSYREKAVHGAFDSLFKKVMTVASGLKGLPPDTNQMAKDTAVLSRSTVDMAEVYLRALAQAHYPNVAAKGARAEAKLDATINKGIAKGMKTLAPLGLAAGKLLLAGRAMGGDPDALGLRLVNPSLRFEEARRYYQWRGMLVHARVGTILSGPADPTKHFVLYRPGEKSDSITIRSSSEITVIDRDYR